VLLELLKPRRPLEPMEPVEPLVEPERFVFACPSNVFAVVCVDDYGKVLLQSPLINCII